MSSRLRLPVDDWADCSPLFVVNTSQRATCFPLAPSFCPETPGTQGSLHIRQMVGFFRKDEDREEALVMFWPRPWWERENSNMRGF